MYSASSKLLPARIATFFPLRDMLDRLVFCVCFENGGGVGVWCVNRIEKKREAREREREQMEKTNLSRSCITERKR